MRSVAAVEACPRAVPLGEDLSSGEASRSEKSGWGRFVCALSPDYTEMPAHGRAETQPFYMQDHLCRGEPDFAEKVFMTGRSRDEPRMQRHPANKFPTERLDMSSNAIWTIGRCVTLAALIGTLPVAGHAQQQPLPSVTVEKVKVEDFTLTARLPGRVKASTVAEVRPQVSGIIRDRQFEEGVRVEAGEPLYKIEDETYVAAVASAKAAVAQAQANYDLAVIEARRAEELFANKSGTASNRDTKVAERSKADAALQVARAELTTAEIDLDRTIVRAPITGAIGFSQTTPGALVAAQQTTALTTIRALDPIYVDVTQSATDLLRWNSLNKSGSARASGVATMILPNGEAYPLKGDLKAAEPQVEPTTGMVTLRITFANPDQLLLPGLYVEVELPQDTAKDAVLVPQSAVMRNAKGEAFAWIVEDGKVAVRPLTILTGSGNFWVTSSGLKAGDALITSGFQKIAPGATVQIAAEPAGKPQTAASGSN